MNGKDITAEMYIEGINLCIVNAERLYSIATLAKLTKFNGLASSLFILSCEESIKAFALYNAFLVDDNRDISTIFLSHNKKLAILKDSYEFISSETLAMAKSFEQAFKELPKGTTLEIENRAKELHSQFHKQIYDAIIDNEFATNATWWDNANSLKKKGFYVGYENGNWSSPNEISEAALIETERRAHLVLGHIIGYKNVEISRYKSIKA